MTFSQLRSTLAILILNFSISPSLAQSPAVLGQPSAEEQAKLKQELTNKGYRLLEEIVSDTETLRSPENRIRLQGAVADLLWKQDGPRARALMTQAGDSLRGIIANLDPLDPSYQREFSFYSQLRQTLVIMIAQHDADLALDLLHSTRMSPSEAGVGRSGAVDFEAEMELQVATQLAQSNPRRALEIAEPNLAKGVTYQATNLLNQLQAKDMNVAIALANDLVKALQSENPATNYMTSNVAVNLLRTVLVSRYAASHPPASGKAMPPLLSDSAFRKLLDLISSVLDPSAVNSISFDPNITRNLISSLQSMMPELEKEPSLTAGLRAKIADSLRNMDSQARSYAEFNALMQKGTSVEGWLQAAARAPAGMRNSYYERASTKAMEQGDYDRAKQILRENISELPNRNQMLSNLDRQMTWQMINAGKFEEARQRISGIRSPAERARSLIPLAMTVAGKGNKKIALQILEEAQGLIGSRAENQTQLNVQIELANAYTSLDPQRAFEILEPVAEQLRSLLTSLAVVDAFEHESYPFFREGELSLTTGNFLLGMVQQFSHALALLAPVDFEHSKTIADHLQHIEVRVTVQLEIARQVLAGQISREGFRRRIAQE